MDADLIESLQNKDLYNHPITGFRVLQTHLSWVILTGQFAYKIKKPLNLGFQDFTTLEKRKYYCALEMELNKRLAPDIYLDVVPIYGSKQSPSFDAQGPAIEYALKMKEFPQDKILTSLSENQKLNDDIIQNISQQLAKFHQEADIAQPDTVYGTYQDVMDPILDNFNALDQMPHANGYAQRLKNILAWAKTVGEKNKELIESRKNTGKTKACHGDLHLGNIALYNDQPIIFDCIEFNENFRWTDTMGDVGFLYMDLLHKKQPELAQYFANQYLEYSGDYEAIPLLEFYACYRAMVRAKVTGFQMAQTPSDSSFYKTLESDLQSFVELAEYFTQSHAPSLKITHGLSASGKSRYTLKLSKQAYTFRLRSDILRKQIFNIPLTQKTPPQKISTVYSAKATQTVYDQLHHLADLYLKNGYSVVIDATCLKSWQRQLFANLAKKHDVPFTILAFDADVGVLKSRLSERQNKSDEASDATVAVLNLQLNDMEPLSIEEAPYIENVSQEELVTDDTSGL